MKRDFLRISDWAGYVCPHFEAIWTSTWAEVAPKWVQVGAKLRHLGAKLGRSWSQLVQVGLKLGLCWPKMTPSRANVAAMSDRNGAFWRFCADLPICKMCKLPLPVRFLATAPGRTWTPPSWSCTRDWQIGPFVSLAAKLPHLGTFGAGGFPSRSSWHFAGAKVDKVVVTCRYSNHVRDMMLWCCNGQTHLRKRSAFAEVSWSLMQPRSETKHGAGAVNGEDALIDVRCEALLHCWCQTMPKPKSFDVGNMLVAVRQISASQRQELCVWHGFQ